MTIEERFLNSYSTGTNKKNWLFSFNYKEMLMFDNNNLRSVCSLEMEEERHYNEIVMSGSNIRNRTVSSPVPYNPSPSSSRPLSPGKDFIKH